MVHVFEVAGDKVKLSVAQTLLQLIAEGAADGEVYCIQWDVLYCTVLCR